MDGLMGEKEHAWAVEEKSLDIEGYGDTGKNQSECLIGLLNQIWKTPGWLDRNWKKKHDETKLVKIDHWKIGTVHNIVRRKTRIDNINILDITEEREVMRLMLDKLIYRNVYIWEYNL